MSCLLPRAILLVPLVLTLSCADMPVGPKALVHVEGTILDRDGTPMAGVRVLFRVRQPFNGGIVPDPRSDPNRTEALTQPDGSYEIGLLETTYTVDILPPLETGYAPALVDGVILNPRSRRFDFRFDWLRLAVHPVLQGGESSASVSVSIFPWRLFGAGWDYFFYVQPQAKGDTLEMFLPPGWEYTVTTSVSGAHVAYMRDQVKLSLDNDFVLDVELGGNVVDAHVVGQGGAPMADATIYVLGPTGNTWATTDADGTARFYLPSAGYIIDVGAPTENVSWRRFPYVSVAADMPLQLDLSGTRWSGRVVLEGTSVPLEGFEVHAQAIGGYGYAHQITDASGAFDLIVRPNWGHFLYVTRGGSLYSLATDVAAGADSTFDIPIGQPIQLPAGRLGPRQAYPSPSSGWAVEDPTGH